MLYGNHYGETKIEPKINWLCVLGNLETSIKVVLYGHTLKVLEGPAMHLSLVLFVRRSDETKPHFAGPPCKIRFLLVASTCN
jgi:hypothetical protein